VISFARKSVLYCAILGIGLLSGCATNSSSEFGKIAAPEYVPRTYTPEESRILQQLMKMGKGEAGSAGRVGFKVVDRFDAASGNLCVRIILKDVSSGKESHRLACENGHGWFFAENIFLSGAEYE
jgi:hypothetical protein